MRSPLIVLSLLLIASVGANRPLTAASYNPGRTIYRTFEGNLMRVIGAGDTLDGKEILSTHFFDDGIDGNQIAFQAALWSPCPAVGLIRTFMWERSSRCRVRLGWGWRCSAPCR